MIERLLSSLGLEGAYQVHVAPLVLRPDLRAHQVFVGFSALPALFPPETEVFVSQADAVEATIAVPFSDLAEYPGVYIVPAQSTENPGGLYGLVWVVDRLLGPGGCPWDREQTHTTLKKYLIEEAYELVQAIDDQDEAKMIEELGDVLLQPVMHAQMEAVAGKYDIDVVADRITEKLVRRHPHVFGSVDAATSDEVLSNWDQIKRAEKGEPRSVLEGVPRAMPALLRALEVSKRAARSGFEWPNEEGVWQKLEEESRELRQASNLEERRAEVGDLLFTIVNLARWMKIDPEESLAQMLDRFTHRFMQMEAASQKPLKDLSPQEWDELWESAKMAP